MILGFNDKQIHFLCKSNASHQNKNEQNDEDQSEATIWIISDFSEEEAMARRSA